ncbi:helix-turn-helix transcriptional regulator [Pseudarthrobacter raffinosi]|uniref:helix-turn-helix transcriptional regulator n=1 Tax=Pseudarthrobacter raffinosi TaxID=2953651 RepID=UPI00208EDD2B|nr:MULTISPECIES: response regulator transcription factor family protein [unclassified Pseudarthrobacter]MCO4239372.1 LuxR C-terminal-related transcriptional regulator [Pseudarthrobacter sp. MDT3-28]MCO4251321.1 LuxR C-terminal-related transcriptional regulator [Pseudarthrobacter sp. MDT3-9]MCO4264919.1 LuxR C-terminal-related transcriptional regulator [Pseudarthrobacter sp. MDT3-26]
MDTSYGVLLEAITALSAAPLATIAQRLREATLPYLGSSALVIFTEDCTGRPQKKAGDEAIISRVSIAELDHIRALLVRECPNGESWSGEALIGGEVRPVLALSSPSNALLVLADPQPVPDPAGQEAERLVRYLWTLAAERIREKVADAPPSYLIESRAASAERLRVTAELVDRHSTTLETVLAALRSPALSDDLARKSATDVAARALVALRTLSDRTTELVEEPVATAFQRLREDLKPLVNFSGIDVQFIEPPVNGRALPGEVAHAARAIVRGLVLAMMDQAGVRRIRTQWDCDGENLLVNVRDDGPGELSAATPSMARLTRRVEALDGTMSVDVMPGWGADVAVSIPLDPPARQLADVSDWKLGNRELEVLQLLASGQRNRAIAAKLHISENTVKFHLRNIYRKVGASSRTEAIAMAHSNGLR